MIDLSHINLHLLSPSGDGKWEDLYVDSLEKTRELITRYGGKFERWRSKYCADISLTRAKLFTRFYEQKEATHGLWVDADMGWEAEDVVRMLLLDRTFLAVAGPRKKYPLDFAYNMWGPDGNVMPLTQEVGTNVAQDIPYIGAAFLLMKKEVANRMVQAYPDQEYDADKDSVEYALFDPIIVPGKTRRRLSEDYAFCHRWRAIGGRIEMVTDIRLSHTGSHTFTGSLEESLCEAEKTQGVHPEVREVIYG